MIELVISGTLFFPTEMSRAPTLAYIHPLIKRDVIEVEDDITLGDGVSAGFLICDNSSLPLHHHDKSTSRVSLKAYDFPWENHVRSALDAIRRKKMSKVNEDTMRKYDNCSEFVIWNNSPSVLHSLELATPLHEGDSKRFSSRVCIQLGVKQEVLFICLRCKNTKLVQHNMAEAEKIQNM